MLKIFAVVLGIAAIFGSIGFANSFTINSGDATQTGQQDIASGSAAVGGCNHNVEVNIQGVYDATVPGYEVSIVQIDANPECASKDVVVTLTGAANAELGTANAVLNGAGDANVDFTGQNIAVGPVLGVHVLIDGELISILP